MALANLFQIQGQINYLMMLKEIRIFVQGCLTQNVMANALQEKENLPVCFR